MYTVALRSGTPPRHEMLFKLSGFPAERYGPKEEQEEVDKLANLQKVLSEEEKESLVQLVPRFSIALSAISMKWKISQKPNTARLNRI